MQGTLKQQLNELWFEDKLEKLSLEEGLELHNAVNKLYELEEIIRSLNELKNNASSEEKYVSFETQLNRYVRELEIIIEAENPDKCLQELEIFKDEEQDEG